MVIIALLADVGAYKKPFNCLLARFLLRFLTLAIFAQVFGLVPSCAALLENTGILARFSV